MKLVLDTNVLISDLLKNSTTRAILLHPSFEFFLPEFGLEEVRRHKRELCKRSGLTDEAVELLLSLLMERVTIVPAAVIEPHIEQAQKLMGSRDPADIPFVAAALAIANDGLWSHDADFSHITEIHKWKTPRNSLPTSVGSDDGVHSNAYAPTGSTARGLTAPATPAPPASRSPFPRSAPRSRGPCAR